MSVLDWFGKKDRGILDHDSEEIRSEERRMEIREKQLIARVEEMEKRKQDVFREGAGTKNKWRRRQLARKFQQAGFELRLTQREYSRLSKELLALQAIRHAIERKERDKEGALSLANLVSNTELVKLLEDDKITAEVYVQKLNEMVSNIEGADVDLSKELGKEGSEVMDIWEKLDEGEIADMETAIEQAEKVVTKRVEKKTELE